MKIEITPESAAANAQRIALELAETIDVHQDGRMVGGESMHEVFLATPEQAEEALPFAKRALLDAAIEDAVEVLLTTAPGPCRKHAADVAGELLLHLSQGWRDTQDRKLAEAAARNAPVAPTKTVSLIRDASGRLVGADVFGGA